MKSTTLQWLLGWVSILGVALAAGVIAESPPRRSPAAQGLPNPIPPEDGNGQPAAKAPAGGANPAPVPRFGLLQKASDVLGGEVRGPSDEVIGRIEDLAINLESGSILFVVLGYGGVAGIGMDYRAVPLASVSVAADPKTFNISMAREALKDAPKFDLSKWKESTTAQRLAEIYRGNGSIRAAPPAPSVDSNPPVSPPANPPVDRVEGSSVLERVEPRARTFDTAERASRILKATVRNLAETRLGEVEELFLDWAGGRIGTVVVSTGGFLNFKDQSSVLPPTIMSWDAAQEIVHIDTTQERLAAAPRFQGTDWPDQSEDYVRQVYRAAGRRPYFETGAPAEPSTRSPSDPKSPSLEQREPGK